MKGGGPNRYIKLRRGPWAKKVEKHCFTQLTEEEKSIVSSFRTMLQPTERTYQWLPLKTWQMAYNSQTVTPRCPNMDCWLLCVGENEIKSYIKNSCSLHELKDNKYLNGNCQYFKTQGLVCVKRYFQMEQGLLKS